MFNRERGEQTCAQVIYDGKMLESRDIVITVRG
jgi:hypothetical protein